MTDNMMPELTLEPTAAAEAVPQLTLEPPAPEVPEPEEKKIEPVEMDEKLLTDEEKKAVEEFSPNEIGNVRDTKHDPAVAAPPHRRAWRVSPRAP